jgi:phage terminase large subunit GpA-like protein
MEHVNFKRDLPAFFQICAGLAVLSLMLLGVGGTIYKTLAPNGWLTAWLSSGLPDALAATSALLVMCLFAWLTREWRTPRTRSRATDVMVYAFAGAGLLYASRLIMEGTL